MTGWFIDNYKSRHRHPLNKLSHTIVVSGWLFQLIGHAIEGNQPAFFNSPIYLLIGPWWLVRRVAEVVGLRKQSATR